MSIFCSWRLVNLNCWSSMFQKHAIKAVSNCSIFFWREATFKNVRILMCNFWHTFPSLSNTAIVLIQCLGRIGRTTSLRIWQIFESQSLVSVSIYFVENSFPLICWCRTERLAWLHKPPKIAPEQLSTLLTPTKFRECTAQGTYYISGNFCEEMGLQTIVMTSHITNITQLSPGVWHIQT